MKNKLFFSIGIIFLFILTAVPFASAEDGVTDTTVKIGWIGDLTGPVAINATPVLDGIKMYAKSVNDKGGINGRKLNILSETDNYAPSQTVAAAKKLIASDKIFCMVGNIGAHTTASIIPLLQKSKTPLLFPGSASTSLYTPPKKYVFSIMSTYETESRIHADYIVNTIEKPRVFVIYMDTSLGKEPLGGIKDQLKKYGVDIIGAAAHKPTAVDFSSQALQCREAKANAVVIYSIGRPTASFLLECKKINYKPQFILFSSECVDALLKLAGDAVEGAVGTHVVSLLNSKDPEVDEYKSVLKKYYPAKKPRVIELIGYTMMRAAGDAIKKCGRNLTRDKLINVLESFKNYDSGAFGPVTFNRNRRIGADNVVYLAVKGGKYVYLVPGWHTYKK